MISNLKSPICYGISHYDLARASLGHLQCGALTRASSNRGW
jgi:hypothetical protein